MRFAGGSRSILLLLALAPACASPSSSASGGAPEAKAEAAPVDAAAERRTEQAELMTEQAKPADAEPAPSPIGGQPPTQPGGAARSQSRLDIAVPSINGGLNRDIIRRIASDHEIDIRECHGRALASMPELAGKLVVEIELDAAGNVTDAKIGEDSSLQHRDVETCVLALIEGWSFADAGGKGSASLSFGF